MKKTLPLLIFFILLSILAFLIPYFQLDVSISHTIQSINSPLFSQTMSFVSYLGNLPLMVFTVATVSLFLFFTGRRKEAIIGSLSTALATLSGSLIKLLIGRPRPTSALVRVATVLSDKSYPSGHVLAFTVFFGFLFYLLMQKTKLKLRDKFFFLILSLLIASIGISRIYLGAHWASDVLGGYLLGLIWLFCTIRFYNLQHGPR